MKNSALPQARGRRAWGRSESVRMLIVLLAVLGVVTAGITCNEDKQCRRDVCITNKCTSRPLTGGVCELNSHCFNSANTCINKVCKGKSPVGGACDNNDASDCAVPSSTCSNNVCLAPTDGDCTSNNQCASSSDSCIGGKCKKKSSGGGICDTNDADDCAALFSLCSNNICLSPTGGTCTQNNECASLEETCIAQVCRFRSGPGGPCDSYDNNDCSADSRCEGTLCTFENNKAMITQRANSASVAVNGFFFVFGGRIPGPGTFLTNKVEMYNPATNTWVPRADIPISVTRHTVVAVGNFVFLIGGVDISLSTAQTHFYRYDTVNDKWSTVDDFTQLPIGIHSVAAAAVGTTIYTFGGTSGGNSQNIIYSFDTTTPKGAWSTPSTLLAATSQASAVAVGTLIYITGGSSGGRLTRVYDTKNPNAQPVTLSASSLTVSRSSHASFFNPADNQIYVVGVSSASDYDKTVEALDYSASSPTWKPVPSAALFFGYTASSGGLIGTRFYMAGSSFLGPSSVLSVLELSGNPHWIPFSPPPSPASYMAVGKIRSSVITAGGDNAFGPLFSTSSYDIATDAWTTLAAPFVFFVSQQTSVVVGSQLFSLGGTGAGKSSKTPLVLSDDQTVWNTRKDMNVARYGLCAASEGTKIYAFGGIDGTDVKDTMEIYETDPAQTQTFDTWTDVTVSSKTFNSPTPVYNCAAVSTGSKILIFGGRKTASSSIGTGLVQSFDTKTQKWDAPFPTEFSPRYSLAANVIDHFVVLSGGSADGQTTLGTVEAFNFLNGEITALPDLSTPRLAHGSVLDGNTLILFGGTNGALIAPTEKYHPSLPA